MQIRGRIARTVPGKSGQPVLDLGCVAVLAHFAIADNIDSRYSLAPHDIGHCAANDARELGHRDGFAWFATKNDFGDSCRARQ